LSLRSFLPLALPRRSLFPAARSSQTFGLKTAAITVINSASTGGKKKREKGRKKDALLTS
jgi:hypothetical protein